MKKIKIDKRIGIIGCGNMGEALIKGLAQVSRKAKSLLIVSDADRIKSERMRRKYKVAVAENNESLADSSDIIILAVKPKDFDEAVGSIKSSLSRKKLLISIAAGVTTRQIEGLLSGDIPVIRVMPNMAAVIGESVSSISAGHFAAKAHIRTAKDIFSSLGDIVEIKEDLVDAITAISGSGPAYFFYLVESLIEAAEGIGLTKETARSIVLKTLVGSGKLLEALKSEPSDLRARVTSKGGTTEAALKVFESRNFKDIVKEAAIAACNRSKALSKG